MLRSAATRALALFITLSACAGEPDPLDEGELQRLARAQGDARGDGFAGLYLLSSDPGDCDCPEIDGVDLCRTLSLGEGVIPVALSQHDGLLVIDLGSIVAYIGGVDQDGAFTVAAILNAGLVAATGELLSRIDGELSDAGFDGVLQNRLVGAFLTEDVDCRVSASIRAVSLAP